MGESKGYFLVGIWMSLLWAVVVAVVAVLVAGLLFSPSAVNWVARSGDAGSGPKPAEPTPES